MRLKVKLFMKYLRLLKYEMRTLFRDPMNIFMLFYPFLMLFITGWFLPMILSRTSSDEQTYALTLLIAFVILLSIGGYVMGALLGFSLLENKDEQTIKTIAVTPVSVSGYIIFKTVYAYIFSILGNLVMIIGIKEFAGASYSFAYGPFQFGFDNINYGHIFAFAMVSSLLVPTIGTLIASISKNKIEGFTFMKSGGIVAMIPALVLINSFSDWKQYILGIAPNFWPVKALLNLALGSNDQYDLSFWLYLLVGSLYMIACAYIFIRIFIKKAAL
jgi:fluoroquinolone transport system permease protein